MSIEWGDGAYERTAEALVEAAEHVVGVAGLRPGERVLDLGCGTGNAALAAARRGARVHAIDPAPRLVEVARRLAAEAGLDLTAAIGSGEAIGADDATFDAVFAIFSILFAPDPAPVVAEVLRVTRPGGRIFVTSWMSEGAIFEASRHLRAEDPHPPSPWATPDGIVRLFAPHAADVTVTAAGIAFTAASPEAWFAEVEATHPAWRGVRAARAAEWPEIRARSIAALVVGNEDPQAFRATSRYLIAEARRR